jgi:hypothetical protein
MHADTQADKVTNATDETRLVEIAQIVSSRYRNNIRPSSWGLRVEGIDVVITTTGETLSLKSNGGQSPPLPGWKILLRSIDNNNAYTWTLYGFVATDKTPL